MQKWGVAAITLRRGIEAAGRWLRRGIEAPEESLRRGIEAAEDVKVYILTKTGQVQLRRVSMKTLAKSYFHTEPMYIYRHARLVYNPIADKWEWIGAKRKNRRSGRKAAVYVRTKPRPTKKAVLAVELHAETYVYRKGTVQPSPIPILIADYFLHVNATKHDYHWHDIGNYNEEWQNGIVSEINHELNARFGGAYYMWPVSDRDKFSVGDTVKAPKGAEIFDTIDDLIDAIENDILLAIGEAEEVN